MKNNAFLGFLRFSEVSFDFWVFSGFLKFSLVVLALLWFSVVCLCVSLGILRELQESVGSPKNYEESQHWVLGLVVVPEAPHVSIKFSKNS